MLQQDRMEKDAEEAETHARLFTAIFNPHLLLGIRVEQ
jgi:hypothetical protein